MKTIHRVAFLALFVLTAGAFTTPAHAGQGFSRHRENLSMKGALSARHHHEQARAHDNHARATQSKSKKVKHKAAKAFHKTVAFPAAVGAKMLHKRDPILRGARRHR